MNDQFSTAWNWLAENHTWVFDGVGIFILSGVMGLVLWLIKPKGKPASQGTTIIQKGGWFSKNNQSVNQVPSEDDQ